jgi:hypothetical protein
MPSNTDIFIVKKLKINILIGTLMFSFVNAILNFQFNKKIFKNLPRITNVVTDGKLKINILIFLSMFPSIKFN